MGRYDEVLGNGAALRQSGCYRSCRHGQGLCCDTQRERSSNVKPVRTTACDGRRLRLAAVQLSIPLATTPRSSCRGVSASGPVYHTFTDSLAVAEAYSDADWWLPFYRRAFPNLVAAVAVKQDGWAQRGGIDRLLTLACGRTYTVDEKIRTRDWPDILLEQWSDEERRTPGWIQKPLACDFIAYAFAPSGTCYMLPVAPLQRAWRQRGRAWVGQYGHRRAHNAGYVSVSVPVPIEVLMQAVAAAMMVAPT
jgi:hypothetical protein